MNLSIQTYLITYDAFKVLPFSNKLLRFVQENSKVLAWLRPFEGAYVIKTYETMLSIQDSFYKFFEAEITFFVQPVFMATIQGSAPPEIWQWISKNTDQEVLALQSRS